MENQVLIRTLNQRLAELEHAQAEAAHRLASSGDRIEDAVRSIESATAEENSAHDATRQVQAELGELRNHINDIMTRNQDHAVSAGSLHALVATLRLTLEALQKKLRMTHENLREFRTRTQTAVAALEAARNAHTAADDDPRRVTEEVDVLRAHIASLDPN